MSVEDSTAAWDEQGGLHPTRSLDDTVHQRVRLGILAIAKKPTESSSAF